MRATKKKSTHTHTQQKKQKSEKRRKKERKQERKTHFNHLLPDPNAIASTHPSAATAAAPIPMPTSPSLTIWSSTAAFRAPAWRDCGLSARIGARSLRAWTRSPVFQAPTYFLFIIYLRFFYL